jgi:hypothetical protein
MANADNIASDAHAAWELKQFDEAAMLFLAAARVEAEEARTRGPWARPDSSLLYAARAAFCLWEGGRTEDARPMLETVARLDFKALRMWGDRRDASTAFTYLLLESAAAGERSRFGELWREATDRCRSIDVVFPYARPQKRMLIAACIEMGHVAGVRQIVAGLDRESLTDPELKLAADRATRFLDGNDSSSQVE